MYGKSNTTRMLSTDTLRPGAVELARVSIRQSRRALGSIQPLYNNNNWNSRWHFHFGTLSVGGIVWMFCLHIWDHWSAITWPTMYNTLVTSPFYLNEVLHVNVQTISLITLGLSLRGERSGRTIGTSDRVRPGNPQCNWSFVRESPIICIMFPNQGAGRERGSLDGKRERERERDR